jgi:hypothetical protein
MKILKEEINLITLGISVLVFSVEDVSVNISRTGKLLFKYHLHIFLPVKPFGVSSRSQIKLENSLMNYQSQGNFQV